MVGRGVTVQPVYDSVQWTIQGSKLDALKILFIIINYLRPKDRLKSHSSF